MTWLPLYRRLRRQASQRRALTVLLTLFLLPAPTESRADNSLSSVPSPIVETGQRMASMVEHSEHDQKPVDLTNLSLEQLLDLDIVPVNVLGAHTHLKGERMFGYRYMNVNMVGNRDGTNKVSLADVLAKYPTAHTDMHMEMHMLEAMYAPADNLTVMAMIPYKEMTMNHITRAGGRFQTRSHGVGDLELMSTYTFLGNVHREGNRFIFNAGLSVPLGGINQRDATLTSKSAKLEYMMQLGSGTFDLMPGFTYLGETGSWSWGAQALATFHLGTNEAHYALGDRLRLSAWGYYKVNDYFGPSVRLEHNIWGNIRGADPELNPATNPAFDAGLQSGKRLDLFLGLNLYTPRGPYKGHRLTLEFGFPVYEDIAGPTLRTDFQWTLGWNYTWH